MLRNAAQADRARSSSCGLAIVGAGAPVRHRTGGESWCWSPPAFVDARGPWPWCSSMVVLYGPLMLVIYPLMFAATTSPWEEPARRRRGAARRRGGRRRRLKSARLGQAALVAAARPAWPEPLGGRSLAGRSSGCAERMLGKRARGSGARVRPIAASANTRAGTSAVLSELRGCCPSRGRGGSAGRPAPVAEAMSRAARSRSRPPCACRQISRSPS